MNSQALPHAPAEARTEASRRAHVRAGSVPTAAARALGLFRIGIAAFGLVQLYLLADYLLLLYGNFGLMQWVISETMKVPYMPSVGNLARLLHPYGFSGDQCVFLLVGIYTFCLLALLLGWQTRGAAIGAWLCQMTLSNTGFFSLYGVDSILHIALFHCAWMPVGNACSVDQGLLGRRPAPPWCTAFALTILRLHLCLIYLNTGLAKLNSEQWWNGEAIWRAVMQPQFRQFDWAWLAQVPWLAKLVGWMTLLIEGGYALFVWPRRTRLWWVGATVLLHLGIGVCLGLWSFSVLMMLLTVSAFGAGVVEQAVRWLGPLRPRRARELAIGTG